MPPPYPTRRSSDLSSFQSLTRARTFVRYPLISEPIYGRHVRKSPQPAFLTPWYGEAWKKFLAYDPLVIWCLPPYDEVAKNVNPQRDMDGVWSNRSEEHTSELQSLMRISYAVFCLKKKKIKHTTIRPQLLRYHRQSHYDS